jgi:hypothetical protein
VKGLTLIRILEDNARRFRDKPMLRWKVEDRWKDIAYGEFYEANSTRLRGILERDWLNSE